MKNEVNTPSSSQACVNTGIPMFPKNNSALKKIRISGFTLQRYGLCANVLMCQLVEVGAGHTLRLQLVFFKNSTPSGLWIMGGCLMYGGLTPSRSVIRVISADIYTNGGWVLN